MPKLLRSSISFTEKRNRVKRESRLLPEWLHSLGEPWSLCDSLRWDRELCDSPRWRPYVTQAPLGSLDSPKEGSHSGGNLDSLLTLFLFSVIYACTWRLNDWSCTRRITTLTCSMLSLCAVCNILELSRYECVYDTYLEPHNEHQWRATASGYWPRSGRIITFWHKTVGPY